VGNEGYRHHMSVVHGTVAAAAREALVKYLDYDVHLFN
jgi:hypothetical protein